MEKIISQLASSLGQRGEQPNITLAQHIIEGNDHESVKTLVKNLNNKTRAIQNDCIKVLYEIGLQKPELIANYIDNFLELLNSKNNRLQWGGMTALNYISKIKSDEIFSHLPLILEAAEKGSTITRDQAVNILINLTPSYESEAIPLLFEIISTCPTNQLPMYAERSIPIIPTKNKVDFIQLLMSRMDDVDKESKRKRIEKIIKRLSK